MVIWFYCFVVTLKFAVGFVAPPTGHATARTEKKRIPAYVDIKMLH